MRQRSRWVWLSVVSGLVLAVLVLIALGPRWSDAIQRRNLVRMHDKAAALAEVHAEKAVLQRELGDPDHRFTVRGREVWTYRGAPYKGRRTPTIVITMDEKGEKISDLSLIIHN